jgi:hypothetical protein
MNATGTSATLTSPPLAGFTFAAMLVHTASTDPVLLGDQNIQTTKDGGQGTSEAFGYTATVTGTATSISVYLDSTDGVQLGLYTDNSSKPSVRLNMGSVASNTVGWVTVPLSSGAKISSGTRYWIAIAATSPTATVGYRDQGWSGSSLDYSGDGVQNPYSINQQWQSNPASVYVGGTTSTPPPPVAAANTGLPAISGTSQQGDALAASTGTWTGTAPITYTYQWQDSGTTNIANATSSTYTASARDVGDTLDAVVTATNAAGSTSATTLRSAVVTAPPPLSPPSNTALEVVSGTDTQGQFLTTTNGSWTGSPTSYGYHWQDCDSSGGNCTNIAGAASNSYTLTSGDIAHTVDVVVTATNASGSASATSAASTVVSSPPAPTASFTFSPSVPVTGSSVRFDGMASTCVAGPCSYTWADDPPAGGSWPLGTGQTIAFTFTGVGTKYVTLTVTDALNRSASVLHNVVVTVPTSPPPTNTAPPTISGTSQQGQTLTASNGSWTGSPTFYTYQWQNCDNAGNNCAPIGGATSTTYALASSAIGYTIRVAETATNAGGSATVASNQTGVVTAQSASSAPSSTAAPLISGTAQQGQTLTTSNGSWSGSPTSYAYQWQDCDNSGNSCAIIGGATSSSYSLASGDVGHTIRAIVTATNASGFTPATSAQTSLVSGSGSGCSGAASTPGGPDPWGGCFPGPTNTGVPAGTNLVTVNSSAQDPPNSALPSDNLGWNYSSSDGAIDITKAGAVIDGVSSSGVNDNVAGAGFTMKDSEMNGVINSSGSNGAILIESSTINGGQQGSYPTVGVPNVTVQDSDLYGGKDEVNCEGNNCTVDNSWLHDNYAGNFALHQQGFFADGNSNDTLTHNSIFCTGGCTADVSMLGGENGVSVSKNLLVASPDSSFCVYPGPDASNMSQWPISNVSWSDNVLQRGHNGQCDASYGAVYGWYPSQCTPSSSCTWTGNMWDDGTALDEANQ